MAATQNSDTGSGSIPKLLAQLALPAVVAQVVNLRYNIVDRIYIGHMPEVGASALTGVGLFTPILMLITAFAMLCGSGGAPRAAIAMGRGDDDAAGVAVDAVAQRRRKGIFPLGVPLPFLIQICLNVVDEGIHLLRLVGVDHHSLRLVRQQQVLILVHHRQPVLKQRQKQIFL